MPKKHQSESGSQIKLGKSGEWFLVYARPPLTDEDTRVLQRGGVAIAGSVVHDSKKPKKHWQTHVVANYHFGMSKLDRDDYFLEHMRSTAKIIGAELVSEQIHYTDKPSSQVSSVIKEEEAKAKKYKDSLRHNR